MKYKWVEAASTIATRPTPTAPSASTRSRGASAASKAASAATAASATSSVGTAMIHMSGTTATAPIAAPTRSNAYSRPSHAVEAFTASAMTMPATVKGSALSTQAAVSAPVNPAVMWVPLPNRSRTRAIGTSTSSAARTTHHRASSVCRRSMPNHPART